MSKTLNIYNNSDGNISVKLDWVPPEGGEYTVTLDLLDVHKEYGWNVAGYTGLDTGACSGKMSVNGGSCAEVRIGDSIYIGKGIDIVTDVILY